MQKRKVLPASSITEGSIPKALLYFFFPILLGSFFQQLYNTADAVIVGRFVGKEALAAAGSGSAVFINLLIGFFGGLSNGASIIISQYYGAGRKEKVSEAIETSMLLSILGGLLVMVLGLFLSRVVMEAIDTPSDILDLSVLYLRIFFIGSVPMFLYNMASCVLRSMGDSKTPLYILIASCFINIILDVLFVAVLGLGVAGAAWATVLCMTASAVLSVIAMERISDIDCRFSLRKMKIEPSIVRSMLYLGIPAGIQGSMYNISNIIIQSGINSFGTNIVAGNAAYGKIDALFWMVVNSLGIALTVFVGQNYGAKHYKRIKRGTWIAMSMGSVLSIVFAFLYSFWGRHLLRLFTEDEAVLDAGMVIIRTIAPTYITFISIELLSGTIRGCGESVRPTLFTAFGVCVFRILWIIFVLPHRNTIVTLMLSYPFSWIITSIMFLLYYRFGHWLEEKP